MPPSPAWLYDEHRSPTVAAAGRSIRRWRRDGRADAGGRLGPTPLGPVETWPQSLRTAVSILLESRFPMYIAWGPEFVQFYNDGYRPILGSTKHPAAMGQSRQRDVRRELAHHRPDVRAGSCAGTAVGAEDWMLPLDRHGYLEECYFTFSYSPIRDESGGVGGVLVTVTETTGARARRAPPAHAARRSRQRGRRADASRRGVARAAAALWRRTRSTCRSRCSTCSTTTARPRLWPAIAGSRPGSGAGTAIAPVGPRARSPWPLDRGTVGSRARDRCRARRFGRAARRRVAGAGRAPRWCCRSRGRARPRRTASSSPA